MLPSSKLSEDSGLSPGKAATLPGHSPQGNYDQYVKTRLELEENQMKRFHWEQDQIAHMKVGTSWRVSTCTGTHACRGLEGPGKAWALHAPGFTCCCLFPVYTSSPFLVSCKHLKPHPVPRTHSSPPSGLLQNYIARFGHGSAKLARQAQSKEKTLQKMMASGLTERVVSDKVRCDRCG